MCFGNKVPSIQTRFIDGHLIITDIKRNDPTTIELKVGDEIVQIDKDKLDKRIQFLRQHTSKSNENVFLRDAALELGFTRNDPVDITFKRERDTSKTMVSTLFLGSYYSWIDTINPVGFCFPEDSIGYIVAKNVNQSNANDVIEGIHKASALIVDLRHASYNEFYQIAMDLLVANNTEFAILTCPVKKCQVFLSKKECEPKYTPAPNFPEKLLCW